MSPKPKCKRKMKDGEEETKRKGKATKKTKHMSLPPAEAKEMTEWQQELETVRERDSYVLENEMFMDCVFSIGEGENLAEVKCHRVYLAKSSPVFAAMLYGEMKKKNKVINLPDVNLEAFKAMLKYIYSGKINLSKYSYEVVCAFLYVAKKYLLPKSLQRHIRAYLQRHIYSENIWTAILFGQTNDEPQLEKTAWRVVEKETVTAITLDSFNEISKATLLAVVKKEHLNCTEVELFNACMRWADSEAGRLDLVPNPVTLREILTPIIPYIRFLAMEGKGFVNDVRTSKILTKEEVLPICVNLHDVNCEPVPEPICKSNQSRKVPSHDSFFVYGFPKDDCEYCRLSYREKVPIDTLVLNFARATIESDEGVNLYRKPLIGIEILSQIKDNVTNRRESIYEEHVSVIVIDRNDNTLLEKDNFHITAPYNSILNLQFIQKVPRSSTDNLLVTVIFHKTGRYPTNRVYFSRNVHTVYQRDFESSRSTIKYCNEKFRYIHALIFGEDASVDSDASSNHSQISGEGSESYENNDDSGEDNNNNEDDYVSDDYNSGDDNNRNESSMDEIDDGDYSSRNSDGSDDE